MSGRIAAAFEAARRAGRAALVPFLTAGDPDLETTPVLVEALGRGGADVVEIGVPFSDPIADGAVIQRASERALRGGATLSRILERCARERSPDGPARVLFTYVNPILQVGFEAFARRAAEAGLDGVLVTDLPPEEGEELGAALRARGLDHIGLVAPTTPAARLRSIARASSGFLYVIARLGVTGERADLPEGLEERVRVARAAAGDLPIAVGFGISRPDQARELARFADGVVVGSALVRLIEEAGPAPDLAARVERFAGRFASAIVRPR